MKAIFLLSVFILIHFNQALAFPIDPNGQVRNPEFVLKFDFLRDKNDYNFIGVNALSNCSGSLVRFEQSRDVDLAMVLTNGHCLGGGFLDAGEVVVNKPEKRMIALLNEEARRVGSVLTTSVLYGTMTKTDMAIYITKSTYKEIYERYGITPLLISSQKASVGDKLEIISGYWRRGFSCQVEKFVNILKEGEWTFNDSLRYSRPGCVIYGGTSGSPVLREGTRTVVAVNNTGNEGNVPCSLNNPCEKNEDGSVTSVKDYAYGQQVYWIYSCLDRDLKLNLQLEGCQLPR